MKVSVITISDRAHTGVYEDLTGPEIERIVREAFPSADISRQIVPDDESQILSALEKCADSDFILTTGGTGISERDRTPDVSRNYCDYDLPGMSGALLAECYKETPNAMLSRIYAGVKSRTIIVNFPGSMNAVKLCAQTLTPVMGHALKMFRGEKH
ncbi:MogA/MoaB family molybdenum cofactor biosynthesis protein [candidate division WOR-3 bacterium]|nr:MogA/MoaB family molybdenum cofactor biosynthesis protein [candidate division WOR-3 bacterium]